MDGTLPLVGDRSGWKSVPKIVVAPKPLKVRVKVVAWAGAESIAASAGATQRESLAERRVVRLDTVRDGSFMGDAGAVSGTATQYMVAWGG